jgi:hypothetical protein
MKFSITFILTILHLASSSAKFNFNFTKDIAETQSHLESTGRAIIGVIDAFFVKSNITFNFYFFGHPEQHHRDIVNEIGRQQQDIPLNITVRPLNSKQLIHSPGVVFLKDRDVANFLKRARIASQVETSDFKLFLFCKQFVATSTGKYVHFLTEKPETIVWSSFVPFADVKHCNLEQLVVHNTFSRSDMVWQKPIVKPPALKNFNNCVVTAQVANRLWDKHENMSQVLTFFKEVVGMMARVGNFTPKMNFAVMDENGMHQTVAGADFKIMEALQLESYAELNLEASMIFTSSTLVIVVTAGERKIEIFLFACGIF